MGHILDQRVPGGESAEQLAHREMVRQRDLGDLKALMQTVEGRRFFWRLLTEAQTFNAAFTGNSNTYYILGKQDLGKLFLRDAHTACLDLYRKAEDEAQAEANAEQVRSNKK